MADYPAASLSATLATATGLKITAWDKILQMRALPEDIFFAFGGNYSEKVKEIPAGIYMKVPAGANEAHTVVFPLLMPLSADPGMGTGTDPITNAEQQTERQFTAYYNDYDKSVKSAGSGIEYIDGVPFGLLNQVTPQIGLFLKEMYGYWMRYSLVNAYSPNLLSTPTSLSEVPHPNVLIKGLSLSQQPSERYTNVSNTMASIIASEVANLGNTQASALDVAFIRGAASYFTGTKPLQPINKGGSKIYVLTVPTGQKNQLLDPANTDGLGAVWEATSRYNDKAAADFPLYMGQVDNAVLVEDIRAPRIKAYGTAASGSESASATNRVYTDEYLKPGLTDPRTGLGNTSSEICFFLGNGAIADLEPEKAHYETEKQYLGKTIIKGALGSRGFNRMDYEKSTATSTSKVNQSSGLLICGYQAASF